jgi:hypothetical protein
VAGQRGGLVGDAFHHVAVAEQGVGHVVDDGVAGLVVAAGQEAFGHGHADGIGRALPERARGGFDARRAERLGVARGARAPLPEGLELVEGQVVAREVQHRIEQHGAVSGGQHEAVAIRPLRVLGVVAQVLLPQHVGHGRRAHGQAGVAGVGLLNGVDGK